MTSTLRRIGPAPFVVPARRDTDADFISRLDDGRIAVRHGASIDIVAWHDLVYAKSANKYTWIVTTRGHYKTRQSLATVVNALAELGLVRVHRGIALNGTRVERVIGRGRHHLTIVLDTGTEFAVGREFQRPVRDRYRLRRRENAAHVVGESTRARMR